MFESCFYHKYTVRQTYTEKTYLSDSGKNKSQQETGTFMPCVIFKRLKWLLLQTILGTRTTSTYHFEQVLSIFQPLASDRLF